MREADDPRRRELAANLRAVRERIAAACAAAGRQPQEVTLVAVTKTRPASDVVHLAALGVRDIGENRDQEASRKAHEVAQMGVSVRWHFIGQLQRNKCRSVVTYADMVQSVDRVRLVDALEAAVRRHRGRPLDVLVQVSIDGDPARGGAVVRRSHGLGVDPDVDLDRVLERVAQSPDLVLRGVMAVAPLDWEPAKAFDMLATVAARVRAHYPQATVLSAGMSGDIEEAIRYGATHVRVGSALLGSRSPLR